MSGVLEGIWVLVVAGLAGFAGGCAYSVFQPVFRRLGRVGGMLTGWTCVFGYLAILLPLLSSNDPRSRDYFDVHDRASWFIVAGASVIAGSVLGWNFVADVPRRRRLRKRWIQRKQRVTSRVHPPAT